MKKNKWVPQKAWLNLCTYPLKLVTFIQVLGFNFVSNCVHTQARATAHKTCCNAKWLGMMLFTKVALLSISFSDLSSLFVEDCSSGQ